MSRLRLMGAAAVVLGALLLVAAPSQACGPVAGGGTVFSFTAPQQAYVQRQFVVQPQAVILQNRLHRQPVAFALLRRSVAGVRGFARGY